MRHLLCHTSGFEGTSSPTPRPATTAWKSTWHCWRRPSALRAGRDVLQTMAGYCVLGRLVEVLRASTYDAALRDHLAQPLDLTHVCIGGARGDPAPGCGGPRAAGPGGPARAGAGLVTGPVERPGRFHAVHDRVRRGGLRVDAPARWRGPVGTRVLSKASAARMAERQVELPDLRVMGNACGLGWEIFDVPGGTIHGHDGNTIGPGRVRAQRGRPGRLGRRADQRWRGRPAPRRRGRTRPDRAGRYRAARTACTADGSGADRRDALRRHVRRRGRGPRGQPGPRRPGLGRPGAQGRARRDGEEPVRRELVHLRATR